MKVERRARITRVGRWRYEIQISYDLPTGLGPVEMQYGPETGWYRFGRARAERKAKREIARYKARQERETWTIT